MKIALTAFFLIATCFLLLTRAGVKKPTPINAPIKWGAYVGDNQNALAAFTNLVGKSPDIQATFVGLTDPFPVQYTDSVGRAGKTLLIFWEPDNFNYAAILSGRFDSAIRDFAAAAKNYGYPIILVPMDEMNGNWNSWGGTVNGNTPEQFSKTWIHVHDLFASATNVKFGWAPNQKSLPDTAANAISAYWPGAQYVDYVGVDGFNGNGDPWMSFSEIFNQNLMNQLAAYGKPVYIFSMGTAESDSDPLAKAAWIKEGLGPNGAISHFPNFTGWIWFNENGGDKTSNWLVNSDPASLSAFKAALP
jgi:hypothetical protein